MSLNLCCSLNYQTSACGIHMGHHQDFVLQELLCVPFCHRLMAQSTCKCESDFSPILVSSWSMSLHHVVLYQCVCVCVCVVNCIRFLCSFMHLWICVGDLFKHKLEFWNKLTVWWIISFKKIIWQSLNRIYFSFILLAEPLTDEGGEEIGVPGENPWSRASGNATY